MSLKELGESSQEDLDKVATMWGRLYKPSISEEELRKVPRDSPLFDTYLDASNALASLIREIGGDPDTPAPVCSCGRHLCRRALRDEEGHVMPY